MKQNPNQGVVGQGPLPKTVSELAVLSCDWRSPLRQLHTTGFPVPHATLVWGVYRVLYIDSAEHGT